MITTEIEKCIVNYLNGTASTQELSQLEQWIKLSDNKNLFKEYIKLDYITSASLTKNHKSDFINKETLRIKNKTKVKRLLPLNLLKYAAILLIAICSTYLAYQNITKKDDFIASTNQIILDLGNGKTEIIQENGSKEIVDNNGNIIGVQQANRIVYTTTNNTLKKEIINKLTVPYGKHFELVLSDGTMIILNSGTSIKYPSQFSNNKKREVSLNGEAFFNVAKDPSHPFVVNANQLKVRVLGTQFNVSAYPEEKDITTVLVEGLVGLYDDDHYNTNTTILLNPGFKGVYNEYKRTFSTEKVDTRIYTSWRTGTLIFRDISFKNIIKRLERNYNITIVNNNKELDQQYFNASFSAKESIDKILNTFSKSYPFNYETINQKIIIN
ncbi:FecR family protein [Wenyingzhuangia sp. IMCC45467]